MKRGIILILLCVSFFAMAGVNAVNVENHDFDGYFSMNVPDDISFEKQVNNTNENGLNIATTSYASDKIAIVYIDSPVLSDNSSVFYYQEMFEKINDKADRCYESQEGNLTILESTANDGSEVSLVGLCSGNRMLVIAGEDANLIREMGNSVVFK